MWYQSTTYVNQFSFCSQTNTTVPPSQIIFGWCPMATAMHALQSTVWTMLQAMPRGLVFSWDMFCNISLLEDWHTILSQREQLVNDALLCTNKKCFNFEYQIGQKVLKYEKSSRQTQTKNHRTFEILRVHSNGTVTILLQPGITRKKLMFDAPCHIGSHAFVI